MFPCAGFGYGFWIFPIIMIVLMVLCVFMMRGRMGSMCRSGSRRTGSHGGDASDSALDTLNKRYARGEINKEEYEEKKKDISRQN